MSKLSKIGLCISKSKNSQILNIYLFAGFMDGAFLSGYFLNGDCTDPLFIFGLERLEMLGGSLCCLFLSELYRGTLLSDELSSSLFKLMSFISKSQCSLNFIGKFCFINLGLPILIFGASFLLLILL